MISSWRNIACVEDLVRPKQLLGAFPAPLFTLVAEPIRQATGQAVAFEPETGLPSDLAPHFDLSRFTQLAFGDAQAQVSWEQLHFALPQPAKEYLRRCIPDGSLLLAVEMPTWFSAFCNEYAIDYLDLRISPLRFARDFYVALDTNQPQLYERLRRHGVLAEEIRLEAAAVTASIHKLSYELRKHGSHADAQDMDGTLVYVGQTSFDAAIIGRPGRHLRASDFADRLRVLSAGRRLAYKPHPYDSGFAAQERESLESITGRPWQVCLQNTYQLLGSRAAVEFVSLSSGVLQEAAFFGKGTHWLHAPLVPLAYPDEEWHAGRFLQVHFADILAPAFWHEVLAPHQPAPRLGRLPEIGLNHGRELLDTWWDYSKFRLWQRSLWIEAFERSGGGLLRQRIEKLEHALSGTPPAPEPFPAAPPVSPDPDDWQRCTAALQERIAARPQDFGRGQLYQGHAGWGLAGQRPTLERLRAYRVREWLPAHARVLDIGCNIGMFGLALSPHLDSYLGIDINPELIEMAAMVASARRIDNCFFQCIGFPEFAACHQGPEFDVVLSFAVHVWIGLPCAQYAALLHALLAPDGLLVLESNNLATNDKDFFANIRHFTDAGFEIRDRGLLKDDGVIERGFFVLKKASQARSEPSP